MSLPPHLVQLNIEVCPTREARLVPSPFVSSTYLGHVDGRHCGPLLTRAKLGKLSQEHFQGLGWSRALLAPCSWVLLECSLNVGLSTPVVWFQLQVSLSSSRAEFFAGPGDALRLVGAVIRGS